MAFVLDKRKDYPENVRFGNDRLSIAPYAADGFHGTRRVLRVWYEDGSLQEVHFDKDSELTDRIGELNLHGATKAKIYNCCRSRELLTMKLGQVYEEQPNFLKRLKALKRRQ